MLQTLPERPHGMVEDTIVLAAAPSSEGDGIHDYTRCLARSLEAEDDLRVAIRNPRCERIERLHELLPGDDEGTLTMVVQYNPFSFGRWGFAPWLPVKLWRLKRSSSRLRIALMVHEPFVPIDDWRSALMGGWQRVQFFAVGAVADVVFTSIEAWTELAPPGPLRSAYHLPVGSNLPDMRHARQAERERMGADDKTVVLAAFGTNHPSRLIDYVTHAARAVGEMGVPTILFNLGSDMPPIECGHSLEVRTPGRLEGEGVARYLAAADVFLAPFVDGVSTRRTTLMAALQHGLPVVGTDGALTDQILREAPAALHLTPVGDPASFARAACELAGDPGARVAGAAQARALYANEFDWSVVSRRLLTGLQNGTTVRCGWR